MPALVLFVRGVVAGLVFDLEIVFSDVKGDGGRAVGEVTAVDSEPLS